jgi:hypothetical protein
MACPARRGLAPARPTASQGNAPEVNKQVETPLTTPRIGGSYRSRSERPYRGTKFRGQFVALTFQIVPKYAKNSCKSEGKSGAAPGSSVVGKSQRRSARNWRRSYAIRTDRKIYPALVSGAHSHFPSSTRWFDWGLERFRTSRWLTMPPSSSDAVAMRRRRTSGATVGGAARARRLTPPKYHPEPPASPPEVPGAACLTPATSL